MRSFEALLISKTESGQTVEWKTLTEADLMDGDVTVSVTHSTINYKDGLAITGKGPVVRRWPMIPGVDFAGEVATSNHPDFKPGDKVFLGGCGLGEMHYGGYSQYARLPGDWLMHVPEGLTPEACMIIGTAGYTSMLAVMALEDRGVKPEDGPILVTGAAGGVGSVAVVLLAKLGYSVTASSGRMEIAGALKVLGATDVISRNEFAEKPRPLAKERWAGAIDVVGSVTLANILAQTKYGGTVAACGLVQGLDLPTTVAPFILRAVNLVGIESVMTPRAKRLEAWKRLAKDIDLAKLHAMTETHPWKDVVDLAPLIVAGKVKGRVLLEVSHPEAVAEPVEVVPAETVTEPALAATPETETATEAVAAEPAIVVEAALEVEKTAAVPEVMPETPLAEPKEEAAPTSQPEPEGTTGDAAPETAPAIKPEAPKPEATPPTLAESQAEMAADETVASEGGDATDTTAKA